MEKEEKKFDLIYEQNCKLNADELKSIKAGVADEHEDCVHVSVGMVLCVRLLIGEA
jgi:hypothetical protein